MERARARNQTEDAVWNVELSSSGNGRRKETHDYWALGILTSSRLETLLLRIGAVRISVSNHDITVLRN